MRCALHLLACGRLRIPQILTSYLTCQIAKLEFKFWYITIFLHLFLLRQYRMITRAYEEDMTINAPARSSSSDLL